MDQVAVLDQSGTNAISLWPSARVVAQAGIPFVGTVLGAHYGGPQCLDTNGAFLRFEKDCFRLPETNPLFQNTPYQESILPEKHVA